MLTYCVFVAQVPYLPSSKDQTMNIMQLLQGRTGRLADLGSGDGRVVSGLQVVQIFSQTMNLILGG